MLLFGEFFKTQSDQNIHQNAPNFSRGSYHMPLNPLEYMHANIINMYFYMKIAIFYSRLFQNTHQNASIVNVFKKFLHENYPIASVYLKYLFFP